MELIIAFLIIVSTFGIGFCTGHIFQLKRNLEGLKDLENGLDNLIRLSNEADAYAEECIESLRKDNDMLRQQLAMYQGEEK